MVIYCVAYGCKNIQKPGDRSVSFHRFPHTRPDILTQWVLSIRRENWQPSKYSRLCSIHFTESCYKIRPGAEVKQLREDAVPSLFNFPAHLISRKSAGRALMDRKLKTTGIKVPGKRKNIQVSLSLKGNLSPNQPAERENCSIHADHSYSLHSQETFLERNEKLREQIKQGTPFKKMRQKKLKPTLHNIHKSQKYQPKVILHRLPKSVLDNYINTTCDPCIVKCELETSAGMSFNTCETLSKTIDAEEEKVTIKSSQLPLKNKMPITVKTTNTMVDKSGSTFGENRISASSVKYRSSLFLSPQRSQKSVKSHLTSAKNPIFPGTSKLFKIKSAPSIRKYTNKSAAYSKNKKRNKSYVKQNKAAKVVKASNGAHFAITLPEASCPATFQLGPDMVKELNEILSTVEDAVITANRLLSTFEETLLGVAPLTSRETSDHLKMAEISSELVHEIKKGNIDMNMCYTKSMIFLSEERLDRDNSIAEPPGKSSTETAFETDWFHNNSEHFQSRGELSLPSSPRPWLTPKIVSVLSIAAQSAGGSKQIDSSRSFAEVNPTNINQTFKCTKHSNVGEISFPLSLTDINSKEMQINNKLFKFKMKDSLSQLVKVVSRVSQVISLKECCDPTRFELQKVVNDLGINDLFSKLSIIIKDSVKESEHYNENAKYILQLISSYSRRGK